MKITIIVVVVALVLAVLGFVYVRTNKNPTSSAVLQKSQTEPVDVTKSDPTPTISQPAIDNVKGLTSASEDLDKTDLNGIDSELNKNDVDVKSF